MPEDVEDFLEHFGVKGMQWGKTKSDDISVERQGSMMRVSSAPIKLPKGVDGKDINALYSNPTVQKLFDQAGDKLDERGFKEWDSSVPANARYSLELGSNNTFRAHLYLKPYSEGEIDLTDKTQFKHEDVSSEFLEHHGVKGMKWGQTTKKSATGAVRSTANRATSSANSAAASTSIAYKKIAKEIGFSAIGPAAVIAGLGPPVSIAIGLGVHVLRQPAVHQPIARVSKASVSLMKEIGETKMSAIRQTRQAHQKVKQTVT